MYQEFFKHFINRTEYLYEICLSTGTSATELTQLRWKYSSHLSPQQHPHTDRLFFQKFLAKNKTPAVPQSPYSSDLSPANFFLFPKLKVSSTSGARIKLIIIPGQLYMFWAMFLLIIRSTWLYLQHLVVFIQVAAGWCHG
jgi:hypothetical protein